MQLSIRIPMKWIDKLSAALFSSVPGARALYTGRVSHISPGFPDGTVNGLVDDYHSREWAVA